MTDFPRGFTLSKLVGGGAPAASITVPATPGISHILDTFTARLISTLPGGAGPVDVTASGLVLTELYLAAAGVDQDGGTGLGIPSGVGLALTVTFSAVTIAGVDQFLLIQGYEI